MIQNCVSWNTGGRGGADSGLCRDETAEVVGAALSGSCRKHLFSFVSVIGINTVRSHSRRLLSNYVFIQLVKSQYEAIIKTERSTKSNARWRPSLWKRSETACVQLVFVVFY